MNAECRQNFHNFSIDSSAEPVTAQKQTPHRKTITASTASDVFCPGIGPPDNVCSAWKSPAPFLFQAGCGALRRAGTPPPFNLCYLMLRPGLKLLLLLMPLQPLY